jgi:hypothetical protein
VMVSDQLAPGVTAYAATTSAAAAIAALQFISPARVWIAPQDQAEAALISFSMYWKAKWLSISWLVDLFDCRELVYTQLSQMRAVTTSSGCLRNTIHSCATSPNWAGLHHWRPLDRRRLSEFGRQSP